MLPAAPRCLPLPAARTRQSNTRHLLSWLMERLNADKDGLFLAVTRAVDQGTGLVRALPAPGCEHAAHSLANTVTPHCQITCWRWRGWCWRPLQAGSYALPACYLTPTPPCWRRTPRPQVKETARRMLTNFSVQASVSEFYTAQRLLRDHPAKALPQVWRGVAGA
jgi:hypothetical protein